MGADWMGNFLLPTLHSRLPSLLSIAAVAVSGLRWWLKMKLPGLIGSGVCVERNKRQEHPKRRL